jgi:prophage antirepressor-like protein
LTSTSWQRNTAPAPANSGAGLGGPEYKARKRPSSDAGAFFMPGGCRDLAYSVTRFYGGRRGGALGHAGSLCRSANLASSVSPLGGGKADSMPHKESTMSSTTLPAATAALTLSFAPESTIRTVVVDGEPWFVAADVCDVLGIDKHRDAITKLDSDERGSVEVDTPSKNQHGTFGTTRQRVATVNESGLYTLALRCRDATKPGSLPHRFRKWITADVLPTLRKYGTYPAPQVRQHAPKARPADRVLDRDLLNLRLAVRWIGDGHVPAIRRACWAAIRSATGVRQLNELRVSDLPLAVDALRGCALVVATIDAYTATVEKFAVEQMIDGHAGRELAAAVEDELHLLPGRFARSGVTARLPRPVREALDRTAARLPVRDFDLRLLGHDDENRGRADDLPPELTHLEP